jgi:ribosomal protein L22
MSDEDPKDPAGTEGETPEAEAPASKPKKRFAKKRAAKKPVAEASPSDEPVAETTPADEPPVVEPVEEPPVVEPVAAKPVTKKPAVQTPPAERPAAKRPNGKVARDKHGRPIVDGPVVRAHAKYVRTSARKARLVCDHIRGKSVDEAVAILAHTPRAVAQDWEKLLKSAVANAEHNHELLGDDLKIHAVFADEGPTLKRFRPRAMGRATQIRKRTSHLTIQLTPKEQ